MISSRKHTWWGSSRPGVPSPWVSTGLWPVRNQDTQQEVKRQTSEWSFICIYSHSPLLALPPELCLLLDQGWHNKCKEHQSFWNYPLPTCGKNCLPQNQFLVPKLLGTAGLEGLGCFYLQPGTWNPWGLAVQVPYVDFKYTHTGTGVWFLPKKS